MTKTELKFTNWLLLPFSLVLVVAFNNCGAPSGNRSGESSLSGASCDDVILHQYKTTVHPFFRQSSTCVSCHIEGGVGIGVFASPDPQASFAAFNAAGLSKIEYMATNPAHKPPYTGAQNKPAIDAIVSSWVEYENDYLECVSKSQNGGVSESLTTSAKSAPKIYAAENSSQTLSWDLDLAEDLAIDTKRSITARITIDVKVLYHTIDGRKYAKGYIFSNPMMSMKNETDQVVIEGLFFQINGRPISSQTTFTSLSRVVRGTTPLPLMNAQANTLIEPLSSQDEFQLYIRRIVPTAGDDKAPAPLTPVLRLADGATGSAERSRSREVNLTILRDSGILRWCLSESATKPASTEAACASGATGTGTVNGWYLSRPTKFTFTAGDGTKKLYLWVANENLKINEEPAQATILLDTMAPAAPVISSISVTDTQVASMSVSHPNESDVTGWCVIEQNSVKAAPGKPALNNSCWNWTQQSVKPTTVGLKSGGSRDIWVFVRDRAGNVSDASNKVTTSNPFGAITYSQLIAASGPRAVITNRCLTCHGQSTAPGFNQLNLTNYAAALEVADNGQLVGRTNNPLSPMPNVNGGLMPQRERDLIKLWTLPEEGDTPLP